MAKQASFEIYSRSYPVVTLEQFRMGDPVLVTEVTGLTWPEFAAGAELMEQEYAAAIEQGLEDDYQGNPIIVLGLMAVAFWHGNHMMSRAKVVKAVERIPMSDVDFIPGEEDDVGPPAQAEAAGLEASPPTSSRSDGSPVGLDERDIHLDSSSGGTSPNGSGHPGSPTTFPESLPA